MEFMKWDLTIRLKMTSTCRQPIQLHGNHYAAATQLQYVRDADGDEEDRRAAASQRLVRHERPKAEQLADRSDASYDEGRHGVEEEEADSGEVVDERLRQIWKTWRLVGEVEEETHEEDDVGGERKWTIRSADKFFRAKCVVKDNFIERRVITCVEIRRRERRLGWPIHGSGCLCWFFRYEIYTFICQNEEVSKRDQMTEFSLGSFEQRRNVPDAELRDGKELKWFTYSYTYATGVSLQKLDEACNVEYDRETSTKQSQGEMERNSFWGQRSIKRTSIDLPIDIWKNNFTFHFPSFKNFDTLDIFVFSVFQGKKKLEMRLERMKLIRGFRREPKHVLGGSWRFVNCDERCP